MFSIIAFIKFKCTNIVLRTRYYIAMNKLTKNVLTSEYVNNRILVWGGKT